MMNAMVRLCLSVTLSTPAPGTHLMNATFRMADTVWLHSSEILLIYQHLICLIAAAHSMQRAKAS